MRTRRRRQERNWRIERKQFDLMQMWSSLYAVRVLYVKVIVKGSIKNNCCCWSLLVRAHETPTRPHLQSTHCDTRTHTSTPLCSVLCTALFWTKAVAKFRTRGVNLKVRLLPASTKWFIMVKRRKVKSPIKTRKFTGKTMAKTLYTCLFHSIQ